MSREFIIYGTEQCTYCNQAKTLLDKMDIPYTYIHASSSLFFQKEFIDKGIRTVPQIYEVFNLGGEMGTEEVHIGGYEELMKEVLG